MSGEGRHDAVQDAVLLRLLPDEDVHGGQRGAADEEDEDESAVEDFGPVLVCLTESFIDTARVVG